MVPCGSALLRSTPQCIIQVARKGREEFDNKEVPLSYRNYKSLKPLDWVVMDHRQLDIFAMFPDRSKKRGWCLGRPWVTAAIDMRTRRWLSWVIVETPNSQSIATCLKRLLLEHGKPHAFYWDNGQDFECDWLDGVLSSLEIKVTHSIVKRARSKLIEPNFKALANFERSTPWWAGNKPGARPQERLDELQAQFERWTAGKGKDRPFQTLDEVAALYDTVFADLNARPHSGEGMKGVTPAGYAYQTPDEVWTALIGGVVRQSIDRQTLLFMFRDRRKVKVAHGQIVMSFHGTRFIYNPSADDDPLSLAPFNGKHVEVAVDTLDLQSVAVFFEDRLVCLADNMELRGMREETFKQDEATRRRMYRWFKTLVSAAHDQVGISTPAERVARRAGAAPEVVEPQRREVAVAYPQAASAARALTAREVVQPGGAIRSLASEDDSGADSEFDFFKGE